MENKRWKIVKKNPAASRRILDEGETEVAKVVMVILFKRKKGKKEKERICNIVGWEG